MGNKRVAYAGIECFDLIIYQARILSKMGKKVLIVENSGYGAISNIIPRPIVLGERLNPITYRNIDFAIETLPAEFFHEYDFIFFSYDFNLPDDTFDRIILSTDLLLHHIKLIKSMFMKCECEHKSILVRNVISLDVNINTIFIQEGTDIDVNYIDYDEMDYANSILCQHCQSITFHWLSGKTKKYLIKEIMTLCPDIKKRVVNTAYREAKGGY